MSEVLFGPSARLSNLFIEAPFSPSPSPLHPQHSFASPETRLALQDKLKSGGLLPNFTNV